MSITKSKIKQSSKQRAFGIEKLSFIIIKTILSMAIFFAVYNSKDDFYTELGYLNDFAFIFVCYLFASLLSFVFSYALLKYMFNKGLHRSVNGFGSFLSNKNGRKLWIFLLSKIIESIAFMVSLQMIVANQLPLDNSMLSYSIAWLAISILSQLLSYFIFWMLYVL